MLAGLETVPCLEAEVDGRASALLALVENLQRKDLHYLEEAEAIAAFLHQTGMTQEAVAAQLGMSPRLWPTSCGCCGCPRPAGRCWWNTD